MELIPRICLLGNTISFLRSIGYPWYYTFHHIGDNRYYRDIWYIYVYDRKKEKMQKMYTKKYKKPQKIEDKCTPKIFIIKKKIPKKMHPKYKKMQKTHRNWNPKNRKKNTKNAKNTQKLQKLHQKCQKWYIGDNWYIAGVFTILVIPDNQLSPYRW